jgi:hypothetical protein
LQALDLTNGAILSDLSARGARHLLKSSTGSMNDLVTDLYMAALCRQPSGEELATARALAGEPPSESGLADLLWCVWMLPEFQIIK